MNISAVQRTPKNNQSSERLLNSSKLKRRSEFSEAFSKGSRARQKNVVIYLRNRRDNKPARMGVVAGKQAHKLATRRNWLKRIAREHFRKSEKNLFFGFDLVIRFLQSSGEKARAKTVCEELRRAFCLAEQLTYTQNQSDNLKQ